MNLAKLKNLKCIIMNFFRFLFKLLSHFKVYYCEGELLEPYLWEWLTRRGAWTWTAEHRLWRLSSQDWTGALGYTWQQILYCAVLYTCWSVCPLLFSHLVLPVPVYPVTSQAFPVIDPYKHSYFFMSWQKSFSSPVLSCHGAPTVPLSFLVLPFSCLLILLCLVR